MVAKISLSSFPEPEDQAGLREQPFGSQTLRRGEYVEGEAVARTRIAHGAGEPLDGFHVLCEHLQAGIHHRGDGILVAFEVRRQRFDGGLGIHGADGADTGGVVGSAAVGQIVAVHGREHHVAQPHEPDRFGGLCRLVGIEPAFRVSRVHGAEAAGAGADRAHEHDRGRAVRPALGQVGAVRLLADRGQPVLVHDPSHLLVLAAPGQANAEPVGFALRRFDVGARLDAVLDGPDTCGVGEFLTALHAASPCGG
jgi:hypothetical protein